MPYFYTNQLLSISKEMERSQVHRIGGVTQNHCHIKSCHITDNHLTLESSNSLEIEGNRAGKRVLLYKQYLLQDFSDMIDVIMDQPKHV